MFFIRCSSEFKNKESFNCKQLTKLFYYIKRTQDFIIHCYDHFNLYRVIADESSVIRVVKEDLLHKPLAINGGILYNLE